MRINFKIRDALYIHDRGEDCDTVYLFVTQGQLVELFSISPPRIDIPQEQAFLEALKDHFIETQLMLSQQMGDLCSSIFQLEEELEKMPLVVKIEESDIQQKGQEEDVNKENSNQESDETTQAETSPTTTGVSEQEGPSQVS